MIRGTPIISTQLSRKINSCKRFCSTRDKTTFGGDENMNFTTSKRSIFSRPMEEQFNSFNLGVTWTEFGDQRESDLDKLLDSLSDLTTQNRTKLVSVWKRHPDKQQGKKLLFRAYLLERHWFCYLFLFFILYLTYCVNLLEFFLLSSVDQRDEYLPSINWTWLECCCLVRLWRVPWRSGV